MEYPNGYEISEDGSYVVAGPATTNAYYEPNSYKIFFDGNGGSCSMTENDVFYGGNYGKLPTPSKQGHTFLGWYTASNGGVKVSSTDKHEIADNITVYAHWSVNKYNVIYDYWTNGGTSASLGNKYTDYGTEADLTVSAVKSGWTFVGWNTDPEAKTGLPKFIMTDEEIILYAIYKKEITLTIIEKTDSGTTTKTIPATIYNTDTKASFTMTGGSTS